MKEQLLLIQCLREEFQELSRLKDEAEEKYSELSKNIADIFNSNQDIRHDLENNKLIFDNLIEGKVLKWILPLMTSVIAVLFVLLSFVSKSNFHWSMYLLGSVIGGVVFCIPPVFLTLFVFRNKVENILIKKYPNIKKVYDKVNELSYTFNLNEKNFMKLREDKNKLEKFLNGIREKCTRKKSELDSAEDVYFNSLLGKTIVTEDGKEFIVCSPIKGKKKVRILEENMMEENV